MSLDKYEFDIDPHILINPWWMHQIYHFSMSLKNYCWMATIYMWVKASTLQLFECGKNCRNIIFNFKVKGDLCFGTQNMTIGTQSFIIIGPWHPKFHLFKSWYPFSDFLTTLITIFNGFVRATQPRPVKLKRNVIHSTKNASTKGFSQACCCIGGKSASDEANRSITLYWTILASLQFHLKDNILHNYVLALYWL